jgi:hypothetical protein
MFLLKFDSYFYRSYTVDTLLSLVRTSTLQEIIYDWSDDKNNLLKNSDRRISFEEVIFALKNEKLLDVISSPTHKNQECLVLNINNYAYIVPFVQEGHTIFLKTIYPSRKHTKFYLKDLDYE